jgi:hypothetical protein
MATNPVRKISAISRSKKAIRQAVQGNTHRVTKTGDV